MISRFSCSNYRNVTAEDVELERVNVLIGPNNCGKTNFLRALGILGEIAQDSSFDKVMEGHGGSGVLNRAVKWPGEIVLNWSFRNMLVESYEIMIQVRSPDAPAQGQRVLKQRLTTTSSESWTLPANIGGHELKADGFSPLLSWLETCAALLGAQRKQSAPLEFIQDVRSYSNARSQNLSSIRRDLTQEPVKIANDVQRFAPDGAGLANALWHLDQHDPDGLSGLTERLRPLLPSLRRIRVKEGGGYRWVELILGEDAYSLPDMSDGTLKALLLATLLFAGDPLTLLSIDEPELNLHPAWLKVVAGWLYSAPKARQILISTHSPDLLDRFTEGFRAGEVAVLVFDAAGRVRNLKRDEVSRFFDEGWELGDLYRVGEPQLGGWPW